MSLTRYVIVFEFLLGTALVWSCLERKTRHGSSIGNFAGDSGESVVEAIWWWCFGVGVGIILTGRVAADEAKLSCFVFTIIFIGVGVVFIDRVAEVRRSSNSVLFVGLGVGVCIAYRDFTLPPFPHFFLFVCFVFAADFFRSLTCYLSCRSGLFLQALHRS